MTARTTLTIHPWRCEAGHITYDRDRPAHCGHCVHGKPCPAPMPALPPERRSPGLRPRGRGVDTPETAHANVEPQTSTTEGAQ